ncbi:MAG: hypothetical protein IJ998_01530, partial [Alistipes sp.]|nr:hypothetical protein [Alistipes sp.]
IHFGEIEHIDALVGLYNAKCNVKHGQVTRTTHTYKKTWGKDEKVTFISVNNEEYTTIVVQSCYLLHPTSTPIDQLFPSYSTELIDYKSLPVAGEASAIEYSQICTFPFDARQIESEARKKIEFSTGVDGVKFGEPAILAISFAVVPFTYKGEQGHIIIDPRTKSCTGENLPTMSLAGSKLLTFFGKYIAGALLGIYGSIAIVIMGIFSDMFTFWMGLLYGAINLIVWITISEAIIPAYLEHKAKSNRKARQQGAK